MGCRCGATPAASCALEPSHTGRLDDQVRLQQFSTPLPLAYAALRAAAVRLGDTVLKPSTGTGMLAVMAECAMGSRAAGRLHLNEIATIPAGLLAGLFPGTSVTHHNAEALTDFLPDVQPTVVLINLPFSATPGIERIHHDADPRHIRSVFSMLPPGATPSPTAPRTPCSPSSSTGAPVLGAALASTHGSPSSSRAPSPTSTARPARRRPPSCSMRSLNRCRHVSPPSPSLSGTRLLRHRPRSVRQCSHAAEDAAQARCLR